MLAQRTLKYIITSCFFLILTVGSAQEENSEKQMKEDEEMGVPRPSFIRFGVDPFSYVKSFIHPAVVHGITFQLDTEIKNKYFPIAELGFENFSADNDKSDLRVTGTFVRIGLDQGFSSYTDENDRDIFFAGLRYGAGAGSFFAENILLPNSTVPFSRDPASYFCQWGELTTGIRTELFANIFLGWTVRLKRRLSLTKLDIAPVYIPGFGMGDKKLNVELSVQVLYAIPYKKKKNNGQDIKH